jgi:hypothetical protein
MSNQLEERVQRLGERLPELDEATAERVWRQIRPPRRRWRSCCGRRPDRTWVPRAYAALAIARHSIVDGRDFYDAARDVVVQGPKVPPDLVTPGSSLLLTRQIEPRSIRVRVERLTTLEAYSKAEDATRGALCGR